MTENYGRARVTEASLLASGGAFFCFLLFLILYIVGYIEHGSWLVGTIFALVLMVGVPVGGILWDKKQGNFPEHDLGDGKWEILEDPKPSTTTVRELTYDPRDI